jgi:Ca-activated chloride channel family protein
MNRTAHSPFGLEAWLESTRILVPLRGMEIRSDVFTGFARVEIDQVFVQSNSRPLDCRYVFPLPADAAVHRCEMHVNGRLVLARVEEKSEAERLYKKAKAEGRRAVLARGERENLFTLELGNLQPSDVILMRFSYIQPLQRLQAQRTLRVPVTPGVRFIPGNPLLRPNSGPGASDDTDEVPDASRISPPRIDKSHPDAAVLQISVRLRGGVETARGGSSPSHILAVRPKENDLRISLATDREFPEKDFVMTWIEPAPSAPVARLWLGESRRGVLELRLPNTQPANSAPACDVYFLLDRSGSMRGENWTGACRAVAGLKSRLDPETPVWLTLFESSHRDWAEKPFAAARLDFGPDGEALERIGTAGGTNMLEALSHVAQKARKHSAGRSAAILLLTDGDIGNEEAVVACAREAGCPVHVIGIAIAPNDALRAVAEETGGRAVFLSPGEDIEAATDRFAPLLRPPVVRELSMPAGWEVADGRPLRDLTAGDDLVVPVSATPGAPAFSLAGTGADGSPWKLTPGHEDCKASALVWARARIRHLERREDQGALALAKEFNLLCKTAAFVAWDEAEKVAIAKREIEQPSMLYSKSARASLSDPFGPAVHGIVLESAVSYDLVRRCCAARFMRPTPVENGCASEVLKAVKALNNLIKTKVVVPSAEFSEILLHLQKLAEQSPADFCSRAAGLLNSLIEQLEAIALTSPQLAKKTKPILTSLRDCMDSIAPAAA